MVPCLEGPAGLLTAGNRTSSQPPPRWSACLTQLGWDCPTQWGPLRPTRVMGLGLCPLHSSSILSGPPAGARHAWSRPTVTPLRALITHSGKHLHFLLFCLLHGQLIIVNNVASLFSKSLVCILFFTNYRNDF